MPDTEGPDLVATARDTLLQAIAEQARRAPNATTLLRLAEAYAWAVEPAQPHGGAAED